MISLFRLLPLAHLFIPASMLLCVLLSQIANAQESTQSAKDLEFFEKKIRPLLATHCYECHSAGAKKVQAGLLLDSRQRMLRGGDSGAALVPGEIANSPLIAAVRFESYEMPPKGKLPDADIESLEAWVKLGAPWPDEPEPTQEGNKPKFDLMTRKSSHWMWQPPVEPKTPNVLREAWPRQPLDRFVLSKLETNKLVPASPIDRRGLIRRLSFDLLGLPPSPEEVERFESDTRDTALEELVDSLLRSPRFGERWGRHWLDLVRYAESRGHEFDADAPNAFQYRDYVIRAFNADVPYDQFVREHIAGDLLEHPRLNPVNQANESILGTGFWYLGEWVHSPVDIRKDETDRFDNMIDVMSKTFLGVTVSCARCHDHKFDAISSRDYYAFSGFFQGSEYRQVRFETLEKERAIAKQLQELDRSYVPKMLDAATEIWNNHRSELVERQKQSPISNRIPKLVARPGESQIVADYTSPTPSRLVQDGYTFRETSLTSLGIVDIGGKLLPQLTLFPSVKNDPFWNGMVNKKERAINSQSRLEAMPRPSRTLLTPTFEVKHGTVSCLVKGSGLMFACVDSHRLVVGPLHGETLQEFNAADGNYRWLNMNLNRYIGHRVHLEFTPAENNALEVLGVVEGKTAATIVEYQDVDALKKANEGEFERLVDDSLQRCKDIEGLAVAPLESIAMVDWLLKQSGFAELDGVIAKWLEARNSLRSQLPNESSVAIAMTDSTGEDDRVLIRGSSSAPGETVPRRFLEAIDGSGPLVNGPQSGRLELADRINDPSNPLSHRVIVNRVWHHLFGRGIVPTVDDFGVLGQRPTDQQLLDHLATWFVNNGRSIKGLIRYIVLSQTYQTSGDVSQESLESDPKNLLLQHISPKRLSGEAIRDSLLAISGELDFAMYGEPIPIHLTDFMDGRGRPGVNGPLDGNKRRSIYIALRRNFLSPFMMTFDTPNPFSTMGKRNVSNVPAQALILLNDPFVIERARKWAERMIQEIPSDSKAGTNRVHRMYMMAFARPPLEKETQAALRFVESQSRNRNVGMDDPAVWADLGHAMINMKEFVFLR